MSFRITGLPAEPFRALFGLSDAELAQRGAKRYVVDAKPGFPDRIEMRDGDIGEHMLLLNYQHQPADTPYQAAHAIFVREGARERFDAVDHVPQVLRERMLSARAFDRDDMMVDADLVDGRQLESQVEKFLANDEVAYIQLHYAKRGCYAARVVRA